MSVGLIDCVFRVGTGTKRTSPRRRDHLAAISLAGPGSDCDSPSLHLRVSLRSGGPARTRRSESDSQLEVIRVRSFLVKVSSSVVSS